MRIERDHRGDYVLDATVLAEKLSIPPQDLHRHMRLGLVTSLVEVGEGADAGLRRLTIRCGAAVWRAVIESMQTRGDWLPVELGFGPTERGWAGAEAGMACEAGGGAASRRDDRDRGRAH